MTNPKTGDRVNELRFEYELDAPAEKVWRAISIPALREKWLPGVALGQCAPLSSTREGEIRYRLREAEPPFLASHVTLHIRPNDAGGTILTIIHRLADARLGSPVPPAANDETSSLMLAA
ncbi:SRPBCC family protein [Sodalis sp. RH20]|uniref:SRPBCC family protein n=1 Tax=unclassified Sodalis (in: enterobacteria) TaxID=2636512 RepID=UPI0039B67E0D